MSDVKKEKYDEVDNDTNKIFDEVINKTSLERTTVIEVLVDNKIKDIYKVNKASALVAKRYKIDVHIMVNEVIFTQLPVHQQLITAEKAIAEIFYDGEKDKLEIKKTDFNFFHTILEKYGSDVCVAYDLSVKSLYSAQKQKEAEEKQATNGKTIK